MPADIIQTAIDLMGEHVRVFLSTPEHPGVHYVDGTLTGLGTGPRNTITLLTGDNYALVDLNHIIAFGGTE